MSWEQVTLADTKIEKPEPVPVGTYVFTLQPGAGYRTNPYNKVEELNVRFDVTEGPFAGRPVFVSYPDPTALNAAGKPMSWSAQALKKLEIALGKDALPGEGTAQYLNRVATEGNARIVAPMKEGKRYIDKKAGLDAAGNPVYKQEDPQFGIFDISPAA